MGTLKAGTLDTQHRILMVFFCNFLKIDTIKFSNETHLYLIWRTIKKTLLNFKKRNIIQTLILSSHNFGDIQSFVYLAIFEILGNDQFIFGSHFIM